MLNLGFTVMDLTPEADSSWYAMCSQIECSFKDTKHRVFLTTLVLKILSLKEEWRWNQMS